ncbi:MAG: hypothetical protein QOJ12_2451, partial [Thermoleophilales bacterium]|nr:hypothetical protein [Thermoleophilales bacterium]
MRPLPAIFVATLVGFIATATVLMTNQFGVRAWPVAPAPQVATRVVAPAEEVAVERPTAKRGGEQAGGAANGREPAATRASVPSAPALVRHGRIRRHLATPRPPQNQIADNSPLPTPATP